MARHDSGAMKIVVTGALGHIGSRLIRELPTLFPGAGIVLIDNLSTQRYASLFDLPADGVYRFVEADVLEVDLPGILESADVVVHLAAIVDAPASVDHPERVEHHNLGGTRRVAEACLRTATAMIFASSTSVYGSQAQGVDEDCPTSQLNPQSPYAEVKLKEEEALSTLGEAEGLRYTIFRFGTIFGTSPGMRFHTVVNKFCWQAVTGRPLSVWRTALHQVRPYLDLGDAVRAIASAIARELPDAKIYNVVTANSTVDQIVELIRTQISDVQVELVDSPVMNQFSYEVLNTRLMAEGFEPGGDLAAGITDTISMLRQSCAAER